MLARLSFRLLVGLAFAVAAGCDDDGQQGGGPAAPLDGGLADSDTDATETGSRDSGDPETSDGAPDVGGGADAASTDAGSQEVWPGDDLPAAGLTFGPLQPWANPIDDYLEAGMQHAGLFLRGVHDLVVWEGRLYLGYGDANVNLGRVIPIEVRSFTSPDEPEPLREFATDEEQIEHYRVLEQGLYIAGVDATEDAWLGNVYYRGEAGDWTKSRTLQGGVHVHDVAGHGGAVYAVGSGAAPEEWEAGDIFAHLWRSEDSGASFEIVARRHNGGDGDARWTRLISRPEGLYVFGYASNAQFVIDEIVNGVWDGQEVTPLADDHPLRWVLVDQSHPLPDGTALLTGVDASAQPLRRRAFRMSGDGVVEPVAGLQGLSVLDVAPHLPTGEVVLMVEQGDEVSDELRSSWAPKILISSDLESFTEALSFESERPPGAIVYWRGALYFGSGEGQVLRSAGRPQDAPPG